MNQSVLATEYRSRTDLGVGEFIPKTSLEFLIRLAEDGVGYFRYGRVWRIQGFKADVLAEVLATDVDVLDQMAARESSSTEELRQLERAIG